jgi:hypothetical protein
VCGSAAVVVAVHAAVQQCAAAVCGSAAVRQCGSVRQCDSAAACTAVQKRSVRQQAQQYVVVRAAVCV